MKNTIILFAAFLMSYTFATAQTAFDPHHPDNEEHFIANNTVLVSNKIVSANFDINLAEGSKISFKTGTQYFYLSSFEKNLTGKIAKIITKHLGKPDFYNSRLKQWNYVNGKEIPGLTITLKKGRLKIRYEDPQEDVLQLVKELVSLVKPIVESKSL